MSAPFSSSLCFLLLLDLRPVMLPLSFDVNNVFLGIVSVQALLLGTSKDSHLLSVNGLGW
jgi:hypothetical protein